MDESRQFDTRRTPPTVHFAQAIAVAQNGHWATVAGGNTAADREEGGLAMTTITILVAVAFGSGPDFVRAYCRAGNRTLAGSDAATGRAWPTPKAITPARLLHSVVAKVWEPVGESNEFLNWMSPLGAGGQACVSFSAELLELEEPDIRDYLAGMAQGIARATTGSAEAHGTRWLAPEYPFPPCGGAA